MLASACPLTPSALPRLRSQSLLGPVLRRPQERIGRSSERGKLPTVAAALDLQFQDTQGEHEPRHPVPVLC